MQGILITCNMNERKCTAEAFNLLNEYADKLYGPEKVSPEEFIPLCLRDRAAERVSCLPVCLPLIPELLLMCIAHRQS